MKHVLHFHITNAIRSFISFNILRYINIPNISRTIFFFSENDGAVIW